MHAMVGIFKMDPSLFEQQQKELNERIVPLVRHQPGFVSASWSYDRTAGRYYSYIVLESEDCAQKFTAFVRQQNAGPATGGVHLESLTVVEVVATAAAR